MSPENPKSVCAVDPVRQKLLDDLGLEIQVVLGTDPKRTGKISDGAAPLGQLWAAYAQAEEQDRRTRIEHQQAVKRDSRLRTKTQEPPFEGWEWDPSYGRTLQSAADVFSDAWYAQTTVDEQLPHGCWRPPLPEMPPNVEDWFCATLREPPSPRKKPNQYPTPKEEPKKDLSPKHKDEKRNHAVLEPLGDAEKSIRRYSIVTALHDRLPGVKEISAEIWPAGLLDSLVFRLEQGQHSGLDETFLRTAWNDVRAELEQACQQATDEQADNEGLMMNWFDDCNSRDALAEKLRRILLRGTPYTSAAESLIAEYVTGTGQITWAQNRDPGLADIFRNPTFAARVYAQARLRALDLGMEIPAAEKDPLTGLHILLDVCEKDLKKQSQAAAGQAGRPVIAAMAGKTDPNLQMAMDLCDLMETPRLQNTGGRCDPVKAGKFAKLIQLMEGIAERLKVHADGVREGEDFCSLKWDRRLLEQTFEGWPEIVTAFVGHGYDKLAARLEEACSAIKTATVRLDTTPPTPLNLATIHAACSLDLIRSMRKMRDELDSAVRFLCVHAASESPKAGSSEAPAGSTAPAEDPKYCFKRCGETGYEVAFASKERRTIPRVAGKLPGLDYIHVLLRREAEHHRSPNRVPDKMASAEVMQVVAGDSQDHAESGKPDAQIDSQAWRQTRERREELNRIVEDEAADPAEKFDAQDELDRLQSCLAASTRPDAKGKPKAKTFSDSSTRMADAIRKAINRAIEAIAPQDGDLAKHFKDHIDHTGGGHKYAPDSHLTWDLG